MRKLWCLVLIICFPFFAEAELHPLFIEGNRQFANEQYDSALISFNALIQDCPDKKEAYFDRAICLYKTHRYSEAIQDFDLCLDMDSLMYDAKFLKSLSEQKAGNLHAAMAGFTWLQERTTNYPLLNKRINNYHLAVLIANRWYYMIAMAVIVLVLMVLVTGLVSGKKHLH
ncbi:MAG: hypothetical protein U0T75_14785 [Chitinophagales bacterium]